MWKIKVINEKIDGQWPTPSLYTPTIEQDAEYDTKGRPIATGVDGPMSYHPRATDEASSTEEQQQNDVQPEARNDDGNKRPRHS